MSLKATVQNLRNRADDAKLSQSDRDHFIETWRHDVAEVYDTVRSALLQVIDANDVSFSTEPTRVSEDELGDYEMVRMMMTIVDRTIQLEPIARMTIGGTGRIDMYRDDRPSEDDRIFIVRGTADIDHIPREWLIERKRSTSTEELAVRFFVRGYRAYTAMTAASIQSSVDFLLNLD